MFSTGNSDDDARLEVLAEDDGLSQPHHWSHFLWFPAREAAAQAAERLTGRFETRVVDNPTGPGVVLQALRDGVVIAPEAVTQTRAELSELALLFGGRYDGWQAWR